MKNCTLLEIMHESFFGTPMKPAREFRFICERPGEAFIQPADAETIAWLGASDPIRIGAEEVRRSDYGCDLSALIGPPDPEKVATLIADEIAKAMPGERIAVTFNGERCEAYHADVSP